MRRAAEASETASTSPGQAAFTPMSWRRAAPFAIFAAACYLASPYLGMSSFDVDPRIAEVWPPGGVGFVLLTTVWFLGTRAIAVTVAFMVVVFAVTAVLMGGSLAPSLW